MDTLNTKTTATGKPGKLRGGAREQDAAEGQDVIVATSTGHHTGSEGSDVGHGIRNNIGPKGSDVGQGIRNNIGPEGSDVGQGIGNNIGPEGSDVGQSVHHNK
jgi:hypothetical protein